MTINILHTADWHAGKILYHHDRTPDLTYALEQMLDIIDKENIDILLVCGDIFDTYRPAAYACEQVYQFFLALNKRNVYSVLLRGNHDSAYFFKSIKDILKLAKVYIFEYLNPKQKLILSINNIDLYIAPLPYPSEQALVALSQQSSHKQYYQNYKDQVSQLLQIMANEIPENTVNILAAHLMIGGGQASLSERKLSILDIYCLAPNILPDIFDYIALGHLHRQQTIPYKTPIYYSGSPYQMDFGEVDQEKGVLQITIDSSKKLTIKPHILKLKHPLKQLTLQGSQEEILEQINQYADFHGYLKLNLQLAKLPEKGFGGQIRRLLDKQLMLMQIEINQSEMLENIHKPNLDLSDHLELYKKYCHTVQKPLSQAKEKIFQQLLNEVEQDATHEA